jgi:uncharacterized protein involved in exopolysaccharide biosynthesis
MREGTWMNAEVQQGQQQEQDEISLLDLLAILAENKKLLILGPLAAGLIALAVAFMLPQKFTSQAILAMPNANENATANANANASAAALMVSPLVLDPIIKARGLDKEKSLQSARNALLDQIKAAVGKDGLIRLDGTASSPQDAQALVNDIIDGWLKSTVPTEQERKDLEKRLSIAQNGLKTATALLDRLNTDGGVSLAKPLNFAGGGTGLIAVGELQGRYLTDVLNIEAALRGLTRDVVKQPAVLPTEAVSQKKGLIAVVVSLFSLMVLSGFVLVARKR